MTTAEQGAQLEDGAVALLDALGFKGIWSTHDPRAVVKSIEKTRERATRNAHLHRKLDGVQIETAAFSDTIILTTPTQPDPNIALMNLGLHVAFVMNAATRAPVRFAYRGCIASGKLLASNGIYIGQAIDEAAQYYEAAVIAAVWFTPSAVKAWGEEAVDELLLMDWAVPLRDRGSLTTLVVNPFIGQANLDKDLDPKRLDDLESRLLEPFGRSSSVDVVQKKQRTAEFLRAAKAHTIQSFPRWREAAIAAAKEGEDA